MRAAVRPLSPTPAGDREPHSFFNSFTILTVIREHIAKRAEELVMDLLFLRH
jgi:hypothetical protein